MKVKRSDRMLIALVLGPIVSAVEASESSPNDCEKNAHPPVLAPGLLGLLGLFHGAVRFKEAGEASNGLIGIPVDAIRPG